MSRHQAVKRHFFFIFCSTIVWLATPPRSVAESVGNDAGSFVALISGTGTATGDSRPVRWHAVTFDPAKCRLAIIDNPQRAEALAGAMTKHGALAGVNGGYFQPDWTPLGLVISDRRLLHPMQQAKLLSGVLAIPARDAVLLRTAEFSPREKPDAALQAGPFLIDRGKIVPGLNAIKYAPRTAVLADSRSVRALIVCEPVTLAEFATLLAQIEFPGFHIVRALNLDGGSSTGMWIGKPEMAIHGDVNVRDYLAIMRR